MKVEHQVCTLQQAKKLKELGISQDGTFFRHVNQPYGPLWTSPDKNIWSSIGQHYYEIDVDLKNYMVAAFTVAELGVMLPQTIRYRKTQVADIKISRFNAWTIYYNRRSSGMNVFMTEHNNEAIARADMLIRILQEEIVSPEEVNQRLKQ